MNMSELQAAVCVRYHLGNVCMCEVITATVQHSVLLTVCVCVCVSMTEQHLQTYVSP